MYELQPYFTTNYCELYTWCNQANISLLPVTALPVVKCRPLLLSSSVTVIDPGKDTKIVFLMQIIFEIGCLSSLWNIQTCTQIKYFKHKKSTATSGQCRNLQGVSQWDIVVLLGHHEEEQKTVKPQSVDTDKCGHRLKQTESCQRKRDLEHYNTQFHIIL